MKIDFLAKEMWNNLMNGGLLCRLVMKVVSAV